MRTSAASWTRLLHATGLATYILFAANPIRDTLVIVGEGRARTSAQCSCQSANSRYIERKRYRKTKNIGRKSSTDSAERSDFFFFFFFVFSSCLVGLSEIRPTLFIQQRQSRDALFLEIYLRAIAPPPRFLFFKRSPSVESGLGRCVIFVTK